MKFLFHCRSKNDLYRTLASAGHSFPRYDDLWEALENAPPGAALLSLADEYPRPALRVETDHLCLAADRNLRLYLEYPASFPGLDLGAPRPTEWERGVVSSGFFAPDLEQGDILALHGCWHLPVEAVLGSLPPGELRGIASGKDPPSEERGHSTVRRDLSPYYEAWTGRVRYIWKQKKLDPILPRGRLAMARKRAGKRADSPPAKKDPLLEEVDHFLEGGVDALSPAVRRQLEEEKESVPEPESSPSSGSDAPSQEEEASRTTDGEEKAELEVALVEKGLKAVIRTVSPGHTEEEIRTFLEQNGIAVGLSEEAIRQAVETARTSGHPVRDVVVAEGKPARPPAPSRIEYHPPEGLDAPPSLEPLHALLSSKRREEILEAATFQVWAVRSGDHLATKIVDSGTKGLDVRGAPIPVPVREFPEDPRLKPGPGVELAPNGTEYRATTYGYAGLDGGRISVAAPIWLSSDEMEACFLNLPRLPGSSAPTPDDLRASLEAAGVVFGIDEHAIGALCQRIAQDDPPEERLIVLARGKPAQPPEDALPAFGLDYEFRVGSFRADGSIDFKERNLFPSVSKDALLAECARPVPGTPGRNVRGAEIPVPDPVGAELVPGDNVRLEEGKGVQRLFAEIDGGASLQLQEIRDASGKLQSRRYEISVRPVAQIDGDVGYETGNIDFKGNVIVSGSVNQGFQVHATGDIAVSGMVEAGASLKAGGDVAVQQGIVGRKTHVEARGSVTAKFVHDARIEAGGDVAVGSYVHGAHIQANGKVSVEGLGGTGSGGGIVGGKIWAIQGIASRNAGSEHSASTELFVGIAPGLFARLEKLRQNVRHAEIMLQRLLKAVGLSTLESEEVREAIARNPGAKKTLLHYVKKAHQLSQVREQQLQEQRELSEQIAQNAARACVEIQEQAFARVAIQIGDHRLVLDQDLRKVRFYLDLEKPGIVWEELS